MMTFYDPGRHKGTSLFGTQVYVGQQDDLLASGKPLTIASSGRVEHLEFAAPAAW